MAIEQLYSTSEEIAANPDKFFLALLRFSIYLYSYATLAQL